MLAERTKSLTRIIGFYILKNVSFLKGGDRANFNNSANFNVEHEHISERISTVP